MDEGTPTTTSRRRRILIPTAIAAAVIAAAAVYGIAGRDGNAVAATCTASQAIAAAAGPLATGDVAALMVSERPEPAPALTFTDADGKRRSLSEWAGRAVLVNLWATWCAPCRHEMPALDRLQADLGGEAFEVVAINIDAGGAEKPMKFLKEVGVTHLGFYADHSTAVFRDLKKAGKAFGLPTTLLVDTEGCLIGHMAGPAEWDSADAKALIGVVTGSP
jgi:thiol-disulfide isomerase/thioredoxin